MNQHFEKFFNVANIGNYIMFLTALVALVIGIRNSYKPHKEKYLKVFVFYLMLSILQNLFVKPHEFLFPERHIEGKKIAAISTNIFMIGEFLIFYNFFFRVILLKYMKIILTILGIFFLSYCIFYWFVIGTFLNFPDHLTVVESFCIVIPCLIYFYELFIKPPLISLSREPSFWITTGMFFTFTCITPLFLIHSYSYENPLFTENIYVINYISYSLLFIIIAKAFSCNPVQKIS